MAKASEKKKPPAQRAAPQPKAASSSLSRTAINRFKSVAVKVATTKQNS